MLDPLLGAAIGAATGGAFGAVSEEDEQTQFVKDLGRRRAPGRPQ